MQEAAKPLKFPITENMGYSFDASMDTRDIITEAPKQEDESKSFTVFTDSLTVS